MKRARRHFAAPHLGLSPAWHRPGIQHCWLVPAGGASRAASLHLHLLSSHIVIASLVFKARTPLIMFKSLWNKRSRSRSPQSSAETIQPTSTRIANDVQAATQASSSEDTATFAVQSPTATDVNIDDRRSGTPAILITSAHESDGSHASQRSSLTHIPTPPEINRSASRERTTRCYPIRRALIHLC